MSVLATRRVLLAGGGSGGHVFPALAVADELAARGWEVDFTGAANGMEARLVAERGWPFHPLAARALVGRGLIDRVRALLTLVGSTVDARRLVRRLGVAVVVGTGGYVSAPAVLGAALGDVPVLLVEPNAVPGVANRWLSRWAREAALAFPAAAAGLSCPTTSTGVPVRGAFAASAAALPSPPQAGVALLVAGGSQGAEQLNRLVPEAVGRLAGEGVAPRAVLHQAGAGKAEATRQAYREVGLAPVDEAPSPAPPGETPAVRMPPPAAPGAPPAVRVVEFLADMPAAVGAAHLVISRAGAITTAELLAAGRPAVLVPLALAGGHQLDNARAIEAAGAALVLPSPELDGPALAAALGGLLSSHERLAEMAAAARAAGRPHAAAAIADRVEALLDGGAA